MKTLIVKTLITLCLIKSVAIADGNSGGGGSFTEADFWQVVADKIVPVLDEVSLPALDKDKLAPKLDRRNVKIELVTTPLKHPDKGVVDALNFPKQSLLQLYKPTWDNYFSMGRDLRVLIFHELLGLAEIEDSKYEISSAVFSGDSLRISYSDNALTCSISNYVMGVEYKNSEYDRYDFVRPMFFQYTGVANWGEEKDAAYFNSDMPLGWPRGSIRTKNLNFEFAMNNDTKLKGIYSVQVLAKLIENKPSLRPRKEDFGSAKLEITFRVIYRKNKNGKGEVVSAATSSTDVNTGIYMQLDNIYYEQILRLRNANFDTTFSNSGFDKWVALRQSVDLSGKSDGGLFIPEDDQKIADALKGMPKIFPAQTFVNCRTQFIKK